MRSPSRWRLVLACLIVALLPMRGWAMDGSWSRALTGAGRLAAQMPHADGAAPCHGAEAQPAPHLSAALSATDMQAVQAAPDHAAPEHEKRLAAAGGEHDCGKCQVCHSPAAMTVGSATVPAHSAPGQPVPRLRLAGGRDEGDTLFRPPRG
ncbi:MAG: hypothetical protein AB1666_03170 [Pseudomonadota bacterium]|uniref:DUF2946 domain-containing protein n=1 Tax=Caldimonas aquatica TaxID=376175 RepID=A0ABY6MTV3_9BURK|nr:hypothetical protein [Schlegelella aquatica]UZD55441.1 hypothetical protein OMP39_02280 [Schlegelella aquatica]